MPLQLNLISSRLRAPHALRSSWHERICTHSGVPARPAAQQALRANIVFNGANDPARLNPI